MGTGIVIGPNTSILPYTRIDDFAIIDYGTSIAHDCEIHRYVTISPQVGLAGHVKLNEGVFVGIGASFLPNIKIDSWTLIGAGAMVTRSFPSKVTVAGIPARIIKKIDN